MNKLYQCPYCKATKCTMLYGCAECEDFKPKENLSIQFAISVLDSIKSCLEENIEQENNLTEWGKGYQQNTKDIISGLNEKIEELKEQLK